MNAWQDLPTGNGLHWIRELSTDMPPQIVEWHRVGFVAETGEPVREWMRWTVAGWVPLVGQVCPIGKRPPG